MMLHPAQKVLCVHPTPTRETSLPRGVQQAIIVISGPALKLNLQTCVNLDLHAQMALLSLSVDESNAMLDTIVPKGANRAARN